MYQFARTVNGTGLYPRATQPTMKDHAMNSLPNPPYPITLKGAMLEECDLPRLETTARKVWDIMVDGRFHDLNEIAYRLGKPHSSITAVVRAFRYLENGGHNINTIRKEEGKGTWLYQLTPATALEVAANKARAKAVKRHSKDAFNDGARSALTDFRKKLLERLKEYGSMKWDEAQRGYARVDIIHEIVNELMPDEQH